MTNVILAASPAFAGPAKRVPGGRVLVVTDYGFESERRQAVSEDGGIGEPSFPNRA